MWRGWSPIARRCSHKVVAVSPTKVHPPFAKYAPAVSVERGARWIYVSGQLGIRPDGTVADGAEAQAAQCLANVAGVLKAANSSLRDVVRVNAYVTDRAHLAPYMKARDATFGSVKCVPASTLMIVSGFARPEFVVEVEAVAARPRRRRGRRSLSTLAGGPSAERVSEFAAAARREGLKIIEASAGENERREVHRRSRDYFWYSPILKKELDGVAADAVLVASTEADVVTACRLAVAHGIPVTVRGAGTGNYGQIVPLRGGCVVDVSSLSGVREITADGVCRAAAGTKLSEIEDEARKAGWELRQHPSTRQTATIGGFVAGGSTGHGALRYGGLSEDGAVLGLRVVTAEAKPRVLDLKGPDAFPCVHAYGTNGVITEVTFPLARSEPWTDVTITFESLAAAAAFALDVARAPAVVARAVSVFQAPIAADFLELVDDKSANVVLIQCSASNL